MTSGDRIVERGADKLESLADKAAARGGVAAKAEPELREDAAFLRRLKPSLMVARAKGDAPKDLPPGGAPAAPSRPQLGPRPIPVTRSGPNPIVVVGAAFAAGVLLAKWLDWRGHAHPR